MFKVVLFILNIVIIIPFGFIGLFAVYPQEGRFLIGALVIFSVLILFVSTILPVILLKRGKISLNELIVFSVSGPVLWLFVIFLTSIGRS